MTQKCFYAANKITKILVKKARNSLYKKDTVFVNIYNKLEKKIFQSQKHCLLEPRLLKKKNIIRTTLSSSSGPFQALQADIAYVSFLARSAVDPTFCPLFVDFFTSKIYTYLMKTRNFLAKKIYKIYL